MDGWRRHRVLGTQRMNTHRQSTWQCLGWCAQGETRNRVGAAAVVPAFVRVAMAGLLHAWGLLVSVHACRCPRCGSSRSLFFNFMAPCSTISLIYVCVATGSCFDGHNDQHQEHHEQHATSSLHCKRSAEAHTTWRRTTWITHVPPYIHIISTKWSSPGTLYLFFPRGQSFKVAFKFGTSRWNSTLKPVVLDIYRTDLQRTCETFP